MDCPRCETPLESYTLYGTEAVSCERCGYLGVTVEHRSEPKEMESWQAALDRFNGE
jgi:hypothetical protein